MTRNYELTVVVSPQLNEKDLQAALAGVEAVVEQVKGKGVKKEEWGKKPLAYRIKKETEGIYWLFKLELPTEKAAVVDKELRLREDILRLLLVRLD